ncbi:MAG: VOC family protein [Candidatus Roizmanbacteria bacterium]|nr:VOC family protein [Candidatus Roizmanbacteria bacterium]
MITINPYLNFNGKTEEAFNFYKSVFGGEFTGLQRFRDLPKSEQSMPENEGDRIMHISLAIGKGNMLMGTDISEGMGMKLTTGNNVHLSLHPETKEEAERLFKELSAGGKVEMPFEKMFWDDYFGSFADKFGVQWMVNFKEK